MMTLASAGAIGCMPAAHASDGTITFNGQVTANTCTVTGGQGTSSTGNNFTVALPSVTASTLSAAGKTAGATAFNVKVSGCTGPATAVSTYFEGGPTVNPADGNLVNATGAGNATGVEIQLLDPVTGTPIVAGGAASQDTQVNLVGGQATMNYDAQYYATGAATAGAVSSTVNYSIAYQ